VTRLTLASTYAARACLTASSCGPPALRRRCFPTLQQMAVCLHSHLAATGWMSVSPRTT
jgi:hypothetical protein